LLNVGTGFQARAAERRSAISGTGVQFTSQ
jgi:hypothetical protein